MMTCQKACDHCQPEALHRCVRPEGHRGYCSCEPQPDDARDGTDHFGANRPAAPGWHLSWVDPEDGTHCTQRMVSVSDAEIQAKLLREIGCEVKVIPPIPDDARG